MTVIELNKRFYTIPTGWNELSQKQLLEVMDTLFFKTYSAEQALLKLLKILTGMNYWQFFRQKPTEMSEFLYLTSFLLEEKATLTHQLIPEYAGMYGPEQSFDNLRMKELVLTEDFYMTWCEDKENTELLNELCSILYRPLRRGSLWKKYDIDKNPKGDPREDYNQNVCSWRAKHIICKWPMNVKLAIATWYEGCRTEMVENNPEVFGGAGGELAKYGLVSVMRRIAKEGTFGTFEQVEEKLVNLIMIDLNESVAEGKEMEKQMKAS